MRVMGIGLLLLMTSSALIHAQSKIGTTAAQFLGISVGPRAAAMGGASVASVTDATSMYWNPGAFEQSGLSQIYFSNAEWLVDTKFRWFGLMLNFGSEHAVGLQLTQLEYGEEEVTTVSSPEGTGERWSARDLAIGASYCRRLTDRFSLGGTAKYIEQRIWNESASAFAFDLGLLFITEFNGMRLGASMSNFGGDLTMDGRDLLQRIDIDPGNAGSNKTLVGSLKTDPWPMPLLFRIGISMDVIRNEQARLTVNTDALRPIDNDESVNIGGEIGWQETFFVRGGYKALFNKNQEEGLSLGAGLRYALNERGSIQIDYAYTQFGRFDNLNSIGLAIGF